ncbi:MAG: anthranilate phosphoribosyltransferase [Thermoleophilia bacterium]|jgi:anthranilate phosphoribosyltransferase|nr:anthranilate phosphoribosyltransferase [Thermoleophilia bacterium]
MTPDPLLTEAMERLLAREDIGREGAARAVGVIMDGGADDAQIAGFLIALRAKGESAGELAGLAEAVRARAEAVSVDDALHLVDTCGTGGGPSTINISTGSAFLAAGAGAHVAKHGNRAVTSSCGSADVLEALGARVDLDASAVATCIEEVGVGFMFAPAHHPAFRHVGGVRRALGVRTTFNVIGPLANPAGARRQVIGVFDPLYLERVAEALGDLGSERALVVAGRDGLDEISSAQPTDAILYADGSLTASVIDPRGLGIAIPAEGALAGGDPAGNAAALRAAISGDPGAVRDVLVLNAGAAIWMAGVTSSLEDGMARAEEAAASGAARERLDAFIDATRRLAPVAQG